MVRLGGVACAIAVFAICGVALASASAGRASCGPAQAPTVASSSRARVYALEGVAYGCAGERQFRLGQLQPQFGIYVDKVRVAGVFAAFERTFCCSDFSYGEVVVRNLRDGERVSDDPSTLLSTGVEDVDRVSSLVLRADGDVAWITVSRWIVGCNPANPRCVSFGIQVLTGRKVLDSGRTIHPGSLKLHGSLLSWKHGSMTRTARLR